MRVIVSGGTGFIGRALVRMLAERGDDVVVLTRDASAASRLGPRANCCRGAGKVELRDWTPEREGPWQDVVAGADAVVGLAGAGVIDEPWSPERLRVLRESRVVSTELLARAIAKRGAPPGGKRPAFVSASAVGYYGTDAGTRDLDEASPPGKDVLAVLCRDWEAAADDARTVARVSHPRIGIVLGTKGGALAKMLPQFKAYVGGPVGEGTQPIPWIHVEDAARALLHAIDTDGFEGPFNVTAPEPTDMNGFADAIGRALGRPSAVRVPAFAVKLALGERASTVLTGQRALPKRLVESGFAFVYPDLASALEDLVARHAPA